MKQSLLCVLVATFLTLSSPLSAQIYSANDFVGLCGDPDNVDIDDGIAMANWGYCRGYFSSMLAWNRAFEATQESLGQRENAFFCVPDDVDHNQAHKITLKYLDDHPEKLSDNFTRSVWYAMKEAFPCSE